MLINSRQVILRIGTVFLFAFESASATTYYIDNVIGKDSYSGQSASVSGDTIGPWRSLSRVSSALLQPGDTVLLRCGQRWSETLTITKSGTTSNNIYFDSFPANCESKPLIDGGVTVPASSWRQGAGNIWTATWPLNRIENSDFLNSETRPWSSWSDTKGHSLKTASECPVTNGCVELYGGNFRSLALAISNPFPLSSGSATTVTITTKLPVGQVAKVVVRRNAEPYDALGLAQTIGGTGSWKTRSFTFTPTETLSNARLDVELTPGNGPIIIDYVKLAQQLGTPLAVHLGNTLQSPAHHPNHGHSADKPNSMYFATAADSASFLQGRAPVSNTIRIGTDLDLPAGASITPGLGIRIRSRAWALEEHTITSVSGSTLSLENNTRYNLLANWGYFFTGAAWMVDAPSEWFVDTSKNVLMLMTDDGMPPGGRVTVTQLENGVDARNVSHVTLRNIAIRYVGNGILLTNAKHVSVDNVAISDTQKHAIEFIGSRYTSISNSRFFDSRLDALAGTRPWQATAQYATVRDNQISGSGIPSNPDSPAPIPASAFASIHAGQYALVERNFVHRSTYVGIRSDKGSEIRGNHVLDSALLLDDGGGIYIQEIDNNGVIENNIVENVIGNLDGKPTLETQGVGVYLDDLTSGVTVSGNTIINADQGMHVHNAFNNIIDGNTFYGNRRNQIWMQENWNRLDVNGDLYGNVIRNNLFVPLQPVAPVYQISEFAHPRRFSSYHGNTYSALLSPLVSTETWPTGGGAWETATHTLAQWQAARYDGVPRQLDASGESISPKAYAQYSVVGPDLITSMNISDSPDDWRSWNKTAPFASVSAVACPTGSCVQFVAGASDSLLIGPGFSTQKDQWYRLSFDLKTGASGQRVDYVIRRGGGGENGFESLMGSTASVTGNGAWKRHVLTFKATASVNLDDPVTQDIGARLDFGWVKPGQRITIGKVDLVPISSVEESTQIRVLVNPKETIDALECPDVDQPELCEKYVQLRDETPVIWPAILPAHGSMVIFTQEKALLDSDQDGIPDSQDTCTGTALGQAVDPSGCQL